MQNLPFRTHATWLDDDDLILLDAIFDSRATSVRLLRKSIFHLQWHLGYTHSLDDKELVPRLLKLCDRGVLRTTVPQANICFRMTAVGGDLWSQERCPIWDRFCSEQYKISSRGYTVMRVTAVSAKIRDKFLELWPMYPARRRKATISDCGLIPWRRFEQLEVGFAGYFQQNQWTFSEVAVHEALQREHEKKLLQGRTWWRTVGELQRFVSSNGTPTS